MAHYPILTWPIELTGKLDVTVGGLLETYLATTSGTVWGFATETNGRASSDSLCYHLATVVAQHSRVSSFANETYKVTSGAVVPAWRFEAVTGTASAPIIFRATPGDEVDFDALGLLDTLPSWVGDLTGDVLIEPAGHNASVWHAAVELSMQQRPVSWVYEDAESPYDVTEQDSLVYARRRDIRLMWEAVDQAHVYAHRAAEEVWATIAGRDEDDTQNILEDLLEALVRKKRIRVYWGPGDYTECLLAAGGAVRSIDDLVTDNPDDPRRPTVTLRLAAVTP